MLTEVLLGLEALATRLEAARLRVQGEWDHRQAWATDGAVTGGQWLASRCQLASSTARVPLFGSTEANSLSVSLKARAATCLPERIRGKIRKAESSE